MKKPKPGDWRLTVDCRYINSCTASQPYPIPDISNMLLHIGHAKAKCFATFDALKGY